MLIGGPLERNPKVQVEYFKHIEHRGDRCEFCHLTPEDDLQIQRGLAPKATQWVIANAFPYEIWEDMIVADHLLVVPKRHIIGKNEFSPEEWEDYKTIIEEYEADGYADYSRPPKSKAKSVAHQHTHLIKHDESKPPVQRLTYTRNPHFVYYELNK